MRKMNKLSRRNGEPSLFHRLSSSCMTRCGIDIIPILEILGVDSTTGEYPHAAEMDLGRSMDHEYFRPSIPISQQHHRGCRDSRILVIRIRDAVDIAVYVIPMGVLVLLLICHYCLREQ